jgi:protein O-mannosyl-transferase
LQRPLARSWQFIASAVAVATLAWLAYRPGLSAEFLFDDFTNLSALGSSGPIDSWPAFWRYVTSGTADPLGRPLSLISFLIDAQDWPADPRPFLRTNLILHLVNGALLFVVLRQLGRRLGDPSPRRDWIALLGAACWLLHPLFVSTTLYAVQREAMLPATFTLLALAAFCHGRQQVDAGAVRNGIAWVAGALVLGTALAALSKANGLLLPLLALVLDQTVFASTAAGTPPALAYRRARTVLLVVPSAAIFAYLMHFLLRANQPLDSRAWTIGQRLITEPRILVDYLVELAIPSPVSAGLFNDGIVASTSLLSPVSTVIAIAFVLGLVLTAIRSRRRAPAFAAAVLFFAAGHALESTTVPLELYFEHRNYLPALLLAWPLARALLRSGLRPSAQATVSLLVVGLLFASTWQRAQLWGQTDRNLLVSARVNPQSSRAQAAAAATLAGQGRPDLAVRLLRAKWSEKPLDTQLGAAYLLARCSLAEPLSDEELARLARVVRASRFNQELLVRWLTMALRAAESGKCEGLSVETTAQWIESVRSEGPGALRRHQVEGLRGRLALAQGRPDAALGHFNLALRASPRPELVAVQSAELNRRGYPAQALEHLRVFHSLDHRLSPRPGMSRVHAHVLQQQGYWDQELAWLERVFTQALTRSQEGQQPKLDTNDRPKQD